LSVRPLALLGLLALVACGKSQAAPDATVPGAKGEEGSGDGDATDGDASDGDAIPTHSGDLGPQDGTQAGHSGDGDDDRPGASFDECGALRWSDDGPIGGDCQAGLEGEYTCDCTGEHIEGVTADSCAEALLVACGVQQGAPPNFCEGGSGICWQDEQNEWFTCECSDGDLSDGNDGPCDQALFDACARPCDNGRGRCEPMASEIGFDCTCGDRQMAVAGEGDCDFALEETCRPACNHDKGACYDRDDGLGFVCQCGEEEPFEIDFEDLGHDSCALALDDLCGEAEPPGDVEVCERESDVASGACRVRPGEVSCSCEWVDGEGFSSGGSGVASGAGGAGGPVPDCLESLMDACPDAF